MLEKQHPTRKILGIGGGGHCCGSMPGIGGGGHCCVSVPGIVEGTPGIGDGVIAACCCGSMPGIGPWGRDHCCARQRPLPSVSDKGTFDFAAPYSDDYSPLASSPRLYFFLEKIEPGTHCLRMREKMHSEFSALD